MPKIFEYLGFVFYFYANEHDPVHVHVTHGEYESVFDLILKDGQLVDIVQRNRAGVDPLPAKDVKAVESFIRQRATSIVKKWVEFFVWKQTPKCTKITKKI